MIHRRAHLFVPLVVVVAYGIAIGWLTWPLAAHLATHLVGPPRIDAMHAGWVLAWQSHALASAPSRILEGNIYHPAAHAVLYGAASFGAVPYFAPPFLATGNPTLALNLTLLGGITATAAALHWVVVRWTASHAAAAIAAATFLTTRWVYWEWLPTAPEYAILAYFPPIILLAASPRLDRRRAAALAVLIALQALTDLVYVAPAVVVPLGVLAVARLLRPSTRRGGAHLAGAIVVALVTLSPAYAALALLRHANPDLPGQSVWGPRLFNAPLVGRLFGTLAPTAIPMAALALVVAGVVDRARRGRRDDDGVPPGAWAVAMLFAVLGCYLSLTPHVVWGGRRVWLPQGLLAAWIPSLNVIREPARLGIAGLMGLSLAAGLGFAGLERRLRSRLSRRAATGASIASAIVAVVAMYVGDRLGVAPAARQPVPALYPIVPAIDGTSPLVARIRELGGVLVEVPISGTTPAPHARAMYRSIFHWAPLLNGYSSYWPHGFPERMALVGRLPEPDAVEALRRATGLSLVLAHGSPLPGGHADPWLDLYARGGDERLHPVARDGADVLFAVAAPAPDTP